MANCAKSLKKLTFKKSALNVKPGQKTQTKYVYKRKVVSRVLPQCDCDERNQAAGQDDTKTPTKTGRNGCFFQRSHDFDSLRMPALSTAPDRTETEENPSEIADYLRDLLHAKTSNKTSRSISLLSLTLSLAGFF
jgi:hypothetical protein